MNDPLDAGASISPSLVPVDREAFTATLDALRESEARFRATFDRAPVGLAHVALGGEWLTVNARLCEILGYTSAELLATSFQALTHPDDLAADLAQALRLVAGDVPSYTMPKRYVRKDGSVVWARLTGTLVRDTVGAPFHFLAVVDEITGHELERLRRDAADGERLAMAIEGAEDGVWDWHVPSGAVQFSALWCRMLGYAPDEIEPHVRSWERLVHPDDVAPVMAALEDHFAARTPRYVTEHRVLRRDGTWAWILDRGKVVSRDAEGRPIRMVGTHKDISARRSAADALAARETLARRQLAELEAIYEGAPVGLAFVDADLRYVRVNARMAALNGANVEAHVGRTPTEVVPTLAPFIEPLLRRVLASGEAVRGLEFRNEAPGEPGEVRDWLIDYHPVRDAAGDVFGVTCSVVEITELKRAESRARTARQREARLLAQMHEAVIATDLVGTITDWNAGAERLYGYRAAEVIGRSVGLLYFEEDRADLEARVFAPLRAAGALALDLRNRRADGSDCWIRLSLSLARDDSGAPDAMIGYSTDITARVQAEAARDALLRREESAHAAAEIARAQAESANRAKSAFLTTMSHELRTPLNAIGGHVQLLEMGLYGDVTEAQREALGRVDRAQRHLLSLVSDILTLARIEAGTIDYDVRPLALAEAVAAVEELVAPQARAKGITLATAVDAARTVLADRDKLVQVVVNLVSNAIKFTPAGGTVTIESVAHGGGARGAATATIRVRDTGIGIAADQLERIFEPFVQVDTTARGRAAGTGLGLAISRDLVRGMGGELRVRSAPGAGSIFTVTLPEAPR